MGILIDPIRTRLVLPLDIISLQAHVTGNILMPMINATDMNYLPFESYFVSGGVGREGKGRGAGGGEVGSRASHQRGVRRDPAAQLRSHCLV